MNTTAQRHVSHAGIWTRTTRCCVMNDELSVVYCVACLLKYSPQQLADVFKTTDTAHTSETVNNQHAIYLPILRKTSQLSTVVFRCCAWVAIECWELLVPNNSVFRQLMIRSTRKPCHRKDDRKMRPIYIWQYSLLKIVSHCGKTLWGEGHSAADWSIVGSV